MVMKKLFKNSPSQIVRVQVYIIKLKNETNYIVK